MYSKICNKCGLDKHITEYHRRSASADGFDARCKKCRSKQNEYTNLESVKEPHVKKETETILTNLGYELYNPDNTVYSQFKRHCEEKGVDVSTWG